MFKVIAASNALPSQGALVLTVGKDQKLGSQGQNLDKNLGGALVRAMADARFSGGSDQTLSLYAPAGLKISRIILVGIGDSVKMTDVIAQGAGGAVAGVLSHGKEALATIWVDDHKDMGLAQAEVAAQMAYGLRLRSYRFDKYHTKLKDDQKSALKTVALVGGAVAVKAYGALEKIADGVFFARDLITEPANVLTPETMALAAASLKKLGVKVDVLNEKAMAKLGMGALLGVAQGSAYPPRLVVMSWDGNKTAKDKRPVAFVGKGVTFDTGGISLKPGAGMGDMKYDMAGAAAVIGVMKVLAARKAKVNVVGVVGLVENMPDANAQRPGDVVKSMSGQTIEVLNTDAEGRLVLADALWYTQEKFKPRAVVDLATLTGAVRMALGSEYAGLFANNDDFSQKLLAAGDAVDEKLWRLPLNDAYDKALDSPIADVKNIADGSVGAGTATAAHFLGRFVKKETVWAHLDIASVAWASKDRPVCPKGAVAFGVRLLNRLIADSFEGK